MRGRARTPLRAGRRDIPGGEGTRRPTASPTSASAARAARLPSAGPSRAKFRGLQHAAARPLQPAHAQDAVAGVDEQSLGVCAEHLARRSAGAADDRPGVRQPAPQVLAADVHGAARPRKEAMMRAARTAAGAVKSSAPSSFSRRRQWVTAASSCAVNPRSRRAAAAAPARPAAPTRRRVSPRPRSRCRARDGHAGHVGDRPGVEAPHDAHEADPVSRSPFATAVWMGEAPRYFGRSDT